ncbi:MAG: helix-turn-helix domain-containing protein [Bacteroidaceae bacterium]|nr:helix-turn-helix domain-containing protein [Bacteroidaceae bacterium]
MNEELKDAINDMKRSMIVMMKNVWSVKDLALVLDVSESRVRHMAAENVLPAYKQNGSLYFRREEIEAWQTKNRTASKDETNARAATYCAVGRLGKGKR